ncbi:response regulator [Mycolicibacterium fluoranthenivorans]|uniref:DNA-binding response OmpR family regulator n=1 Tax=Mycolicibacterium fluoranthenivorans TaxID=258505 RepID=A0A7X5TVW4_9MYCO|nr:response regulator [Mycolicibacterium fluoranthenivorans]MCV7359110.1 response regulator [Mycolicibacterium fluoranthenivorans]NIH93706.1 DNA-binding response OmpR family regulator [Mycolicibacterium fluoranthenivorans]
MNVLVAVGDRGLAEQIVTGLIRQAITVDSVFDGLSALECIAAQDYEVVVLDRYLPVTGGDVVCTHLVDSGSATRVLLLTPSAAHATEWWLGADDHLCSPFAAAKVIARVRVLGAVQHHDGADEQQDPWPTQKTAHG